MLNNFLKWETSQDPTVNTIPPVDWCSPAYPPLQSLDSGPPYNLSRSLRQEWDSVRDGECDSVCKACVHHVLTCTVRVGPWTLFRRGKKVIWPNSNLFSFLTKNDTGSKSSEWLICLTWVCTFFFRVLWPLSGHEHHDERSGYQDPRPQSRRHLTVGDQSGMWGRKLAWRDCVWPALGILHSKL